MQSDMTPENTLPPILCLPKLRTIVIHPMNADQPYWLLGWRPSTCGNIAVLVLSVAVSDVLVTMHMPIKIWERAAATSC